MRKLPVILALGVLSLAACDRDKDYPGDGACPTDLWPYKVVLTGADGKNLVYGPDAKFSPDSVNINNALSSYHKVGVRTLGDSPFVTIPQVRMPKNIFSVSVTRNGKATVHVVSFELTSPMNCYGRVKKITVEGGSACVDCKPYPTIKLPY
ncbi:hypothetical protein MKQ68_23815 [Chitinophaga horti]|uniref:Lipoprotein n=1 Tax=Chitinophaga horti TaxID=2920382 RepID=A0ABY6J396_9BACT|nr:hypothetical protein [Chitinophaga horti]UYQ93112.1 hypothetical protein MKQ68_23815 [Chitinophaga horti]